MIVAVSQKRPDTKRECSICAIADHNGRLSFNKVHLLFEARSTEAVDPSRARLRPERLQQFEAPRRDDSRILTRAEREGPAVHNGLFLDVRKQHAAARTRR